MLSFYGKSSLILNTLSPFVLHWRKKITLVSVWNQIWVNYDRILVFKLTIHYTHPNLTIMMAEFKNCLFRTWIRRLEQIFNSQISFQSSAGCTSTYFVHGMTLCLCAGLHPSKAKLELQKHLACLDNQEQAAVFESTMVSYFNFKTAITLHKYALAPRFFGLAVCVKSFKCGIRGMCFSFQRVWLV